MHHAVILLSSAKQAWDHTGDAHNPMVDGMAVPAGEHADLLRESVAVMVREIMEVEIGQLAGAELGERAPGRRSAQRNGYRDRRWDTRVGEIELAIPKLRTGSYLPSF